MKLIWAILRWLLSKIFIIIAIVGVVIILHFLYDQTRFLQEEIQKELQRAEAELTKIAARKVEAESVQRNLRLRLREEQQTLVAAAQSLAIELAGKENERTELLNEISAADRQIAALNYQIEKHQAEKPWFMDWGLRPIDGPKWEAQLKALEASRATIIKTKNGFEQHKRELHKAIALTREQLMQQPQAPDEKLLEAVEKAEKELEQINDLAESTVANKMRLRERSQQFQNFKRRFLELPSVLKNNLARYRWQILWLVIFVLCGPMVWKMFWYFGLAKATSRVRSICLDEEAPAASCEAKACGKTAEIKIDADHPLIARMDWIQQYSPDTVKRTRFLWSFKAPFISYAAGLVDMTEFRLNQPANEATLVLGSSHDPQYHLLRLDLLNHPGFVLKPSMVVAASPSIKIRTRWTLRNLHSWISGRWRHILFHGTGAIFVMGYGSIHAVDTTNGAIRIEDGHVVGFDSRTRFSTVRTETFWPYFKDKTALFDWEFSGYGQVIRQNVLPQAQRKISNPFVKTADSIFNVIGKLLGF